MTFEEWVGANLDRLFAFATVLIGERALAEDVVMECLAKIYERWDRLAEVDDLGAYARRMVVNQHVSWRRKWSRQLPSAEPPAVVSPTDFTAHHAERQALIEALQQLPPKQRAAVVLRYYEDLDPVEIAAVLHCLPVTARGYLSRALRNLRVALDEPADAPVPGAS